MDEESREKLDKVYEAIFIGNGKDALMSRIAVAETEQKNTTKAVEDMDRKLSKIGLMVAGVFLTMLVEIIVKGIWH